MATYRMSVSVLSRGSGRSAVAAAAYRSGTKIVNERDGVVHDYRCKQGVLAHGVELPKNAPEGWHDRATLWNDVEAIEKSDNAQVAREFQLSLPHELSLEQNIELVREFCSERIREGMVCDWAIHIPYGGDERNIHAHVLCAMRSCDANGFKAKSENQYLMDLYGMESKYVSAREAKKFLATGWEKVYRYRDTSTNKIKEMTPSKADYENNSSKRLGLDHEYVRVSKTPVQKSVYFNDWNNKDNVERWRAEWEQLENTALERASVPERVDHRSYERQGVDLVPQPKMGAAVTAMERRHKRECEREGKPYEPITDRGQEVAAAVQHNSLIVALMQAKEALEQQIRELRDLLREEVQRLREMNVTVSTRQRQTPEQTLAAPLSPFSQQQPTIEAPTVDPSPQRDKGFDFGL